MSHIELAALVARDYGAGEMSGVSCERQQQPLHANSIWEARNPYLGRQRPRAAVLSPSSLRRMRLPVAASHDRRQPRRRDPDGVVPFARRLALAEAGPCSGKSGHTLSLFVLERHERIDARGAEAGIRLAAAATAVMIAATPASVAGSFGRTSKSSVSISRVSTSAPARPATRPAHVSFRPCAHHRAEHDARSAPSAIRIPISRRCWAPCTRAHRRCRSRPAGAPGPRTPARSCISMRGRRTESRNTSSMLRNRMIGSADRPHARRSRSVAAARQPAMWCAA